MSAERPIELLLTDDLQRSRITVGLRAILAIPHFIWAFLWSIVAFFAVLANWIATLLLGRSPGWLHRFLAAYVKYATQLYAYLRIAANPYPSFDGPDGYPVDLRIAPPARQRRLTVLARVLLALPAFVLAEAIAGGSGSELLSRNGSTFAGGLAGSCAVLGWFVSVGKRRMPRGLRDAEAWGLLYAAQVWAYLLMLTDVYPDSDPLAVPGLPHREDPVRARSSDDLRRSRLTAAFRLPLCFPHFIWLFLWSVLAIPTAISIWIATLLRGQPPRALHAFLSRYVRYTIDVYAFLYLFANPFPGFAGTAGSYPAFEIEIAPPDRQNRWKTLFRLVLTIPALLLGAAYSSIASILGVFGWFSSLLFGRVPTGLRNAGALSLRYYAQTLGYVLMLTDAYPYTGPVLSDGAGPAERHPEDAAPESGLLPPTTVASV